jgi:glycosyltransferase involved in cell wall biosynthesis
MRVLRLNDWTGPPGGAEAYIRSVGSALEAEGHPQHLLSLTNAPATVHRPEPWEEVFPIEPLGAKRVFEDLTDSPRLEQVLDTAWRSFHPDLLHLHHFDSQFATVARWLSRVPTPLVMTAHDAKLVCPIGTLTLPDGSTCEGRILPRCQFTGCEVGWGLPYKLAQDRVFRTTVLPRVRLFLAPSRAAQGILERNGLGPVRVLPPFIEESPGALDRSAPLPAGPPVIGFLGRFEPYKGASVLLEAFHTFRETYPGARLLLCGRGPEEPHLRQQVERLGLGEAVEFPGWVEGERKEEFFRRIHLLAVPSMGYENFGLIGLEAMMRGRPALGSRLGGIPDWLQDGENGRLVPPGQVDAWSKALEEAFGSPETLARWGERARELYWDRFRPERHVREIVEIYSEVLAGR